MINQETHTAALVVILIGGLCLMLACSMLYIQNGMIERLNSDLAHTQQKLDIANIEKTKWRDRAAVCNTIRSMGEKV